MGVEFIFRRGRKAQLSQNANVAARPCVCLHRESVSAFEKSCVVYLIFKMLFFLFAARHINSGCQAWQSDCGDFQSQFMTLSQETIEPFIHSLSLTL